MKLKLILLVLHIDFILGTIDENSTYWTGKLQRCGPKLAAELAIICRGIYNEATSKYNLSIVSDYQLQQFVFGNFPVKCIKRCI